MRKIGIFILIVALLLACVAIPVTATDDIFLYKLDMAAAGKSVSDLSSLAAGTEVDVTLTVTNSSGLATYNAYGLEFDLKGTGITDISGACEFSGFKTPSVTWNSFIGGYKISFVWGSMIDKTCREVANPLQMQIHFTVADPSNAALWVEHALLFPEGSTSAVLAQDANPVDLAFSNIENYYIPETAVNFPISTINLAKGVKNGSGFYSFTKISGPDWIQISKDGKITGTPTSVQKSTELTVKIADTILKGKEIPVTIKVCPIVPCRICSVSVADNQSTINFDGNTRKGDTLIGVRYRDGRLVGIVFNILPEESTSYTSSLPFGTGETIKWMLLDKFFLPICNAA